jgi:hypothetical protein
MPITESESISDLAHRRSGLFGLISTNELPVKPSQGDTTYKGVCNLIDNKCIVVSGYSFSRA